MYVASLKCIDVDEWLLFAPRVDSLNHARSGVDNDPVHLPHLQIPKNQKVPTGK